MIILSRSRIPLQVAAIAIATAILQFAGTVSVHAQTTTDVAAPVPPVPFHPSEDVGENTMLPSTAVYYVHSQLHLHPDLDQGDLARSLEPYVREEGLSEHEQFFLAEFRFISFRAEAAYAGFFQFEDQDNWYGRTARIRRQIMEIRAFEDFEALENNVREYRQIFEPQPEFLSGLAYGESVLCNRQVAAGEAAGAVDLITATILALPQDAPYESINLLWSCYSAFESSSRTDEAVTLAETVHGYLSPLLEARRAQTAQYIEYDPELFENSRDHNWWRTSTTAPENYLTWRLENMIALLDRFIDCRRDGDEAACATFIAPD